jgi:hypothetical protein
MHAERDELVEARALVAEALPLIRTIGQTGPVLQLVAFVDRLGLRDDLLEAMEATRPQRSSLFREAATVALKSDAIQAADIISGSGAVTIEANLRFRGGQQLLELGRHTEGKVELERALAFYRSVDASAYVAEIEAALAGAQSASA